MKTAAALPGLDDGGILPEFALLVCSARETSEVVSN